MGALETVNRLQASCLADGASATLLNSNGIVSLTRNGGGTYTVVLEQPVSLAQAVIICDVDGANGFTAYNQGDPGEEESLEILIQTFDGANPAVAADQRFTLNVWQLPRLEQP